MVSGRKERAYGILLLCYCLLTVVYCILRASLLGLTHDEAVSYLFQKIFVRSYWDILTYSPPAANSHLLNTLLMRFFSGVLGDSEIVLRASAIFALLLYLPGLYLTLRLFLKGLALFLGFVFCSAHPFLIDYFSCARGYGLAVGFMIWGIYFLMRAIQSDESGSGKGPIFVSLSALAFSVSVMGNFSFLQGYVVFVLVYFVLFWLQAGKRKRPPEGGLGLAKEFFKGFLIPLVPSVFVLLFFCLVPLIKLILAGEFYYGGTTGFWADTVGSLIHVTIYAGTRDLSRWVPGITIASKGFIVFSMLVALGVLLRDRFNRLWDVKDWFLLAMTMFLVFAAVVIAAQHDAFGSRYVTDRTAIYFIPVFSLFLLLLGARMCEIFSGRLQGMAKFFFVLFLVLMAGHYFSRVNLRYYLMSIPDADIKDMMQDLTDMNRSRLSLLSPRSVSLGINWLSEPVINYYILRNNLWWLRFVHRKGPKGHFDYYYLFLNPDFDNRDLVVRYGLQILKTYSTYNTFLAAAPESGGNAR